MQERNKGKNELIQECQNHSIGKQHVFSINGGETTGYAHAMNEAGTLPHTTYKYQLER